MPCTQDTPLRFTESDDNQLNRKRPREAAYWLHDAVNRGMVQSMDETAGPSALKVSVCG